MVFKIQSIPPVVLVHERLPLGDDSFHIPELPVAGSEFPAGTVVDVDADPANQYSVNRTMPSQYLQLEVENHVELLSIKAHSF